MFGILTYFRKQFHHEPELYDITGHADLLFSSFKDIGIPNPDFQYLFREHKENPESVDQDSAHLLYYLSKMIHASVAIEVGIYRGAGSLHLAQALSENGGGELHLVDISSDYLKNVSHKLAEQKYDVKVKMHTGYSNDEKIIKKLPQADIIFIDADHSLAAVRQDVENYWPLVKSNGVLVIHDTVMWPGARTVANELCSKGFAITTLATNGGAGISIVRNTHV